ncbi:hypothetical protein Ndes2526B_g04658 [Nannochloris sp. 'desiccata']|nr:hypothetical protein KSW81_000615 [Chlorella desiccata (nom. nud.)]KAH7620740.1 hypothetical protein NADE_003353 [Chlorella desiccata (nom. nud.)]
MGRSQAGRLIFSVFGAVLTGVGIVALRSCCGRGKKARQAKREANAITRALSNGPNSHKLEDGLLVALSTGSAESAMATNSTSALTATELKAQRRAAFEDAAALIRIPATLDAFTTVLMDGPIILSLAPQLRTLMSQLDELDMAMGWPTGGDDLLWRGYGMDKVAQVVLARSPGLVRPALAMQVVALRCGLRSLLQQRQAAREPNNVVEIVEINDEEEAVFSPPAISTVTAAAPPTLALGRSISDASSSGTPGGCTPMSAHGSVLGPFTAANGGKKTKAKSPLGDCTRQGSAPVNAVPAAGRLGLNPGAEPWVPGPAPRDRPRRKRRGRSGYHCVVTDVPAPPPPLRAAAAAPVLRQKHLCQGLLAI